MGQTQTVKNFVSTTYQGVSEQIASLFRGDLLLAQREEVLLALNLEGTGLSLPTLQSLLILFEQDTDLFLKVGMALVSESREVLVPEILLEFQIVLGKTLLGHGQFGDAKTVLTLACELARQIGKKWELSEIQNMLAGAFFSLGDTQGALRLLLESADTKDKLGDGVGKVKTLINVGKVKIELGDFVGALESLTQSHAWIIHHGISKNLELLCLNNIAICYEKLDSVHKAVDIYKSVAEIATQIGDDRAYVLSSINIGNVFIKEAHIEEAVAYFTDALERSRSLHYPHFQADALEGLGQAHLALGQWEGALHYLGQALEHSKALEDREGETDVRLLLGKTHLAQLDYAGAQAQLARALELAQESERLNTLSEAHHLLSEACEGQQDLKAALEHFRHYHRLQARLFNQESEKLSATLSIQFELERAKVETETYKLRTELEQRARIDAEALVFERTFDLEQAQIEIVNRLALAAEYRDDQTGEHTLRVGRYAAEIARHMGWEAPEVSLMQQAARLHDVGKIGIPDSILLKPGKLTPEEFAYMKSHTSIGGRILSGGHSRLVLLAETIALSHHERWDGNGYPQGLSGEDIPLEGRIVAVADVFDALRQVRPYKKAWTREEAWFELSAQSGKQFDPSIIEIFGRLLEDGVDEFKALENE